MIGAQVAIEGGRLRGKKGEKEGGRGCCWISEDPLYRKGKLSGLERKGVNGYKFYE